MPDVGTLKNICENLDTMGLGLDDTFRFKCYGCGKCCKNRQDILLNPRDLFRLAVYLKLTPEQVIAHYGHKYLGQNSCIPLVRLKPVGKNNCCPFLNGNRCAVHASKPIVCALFPLGRYKKRAEENPDAQMETGYILQPVTCSGHKPTTVRTHLESFGIPIQDDFFVKWSETLAYLTTFCGEMIRLGASPMGMQLIWKQIEECLYNLYDTSKEFESQFDGNIAALKKVLGSIRTRITMSPTGKLGQTPSAQ